MTMVPLGVPLGCSEPYLIVAPLASGAEALKVPQVKPAGSSNLGGSKGMSSGG
jgi:hypothetical protein